VIDSHITRRVLRFKFPSVLWHCWLGDRKGIQPEKTCASLVTRDSFPEQMEEVDWGKPGNAGLPGKRPLKWTWWYFLLSVVYCLSLLVYII